MSQFWYDRVMKRLLRKYIVATLALFLASNLYSGGIVFNDGPYAVFVAGLILAVLLLLIKPLLDLITLPLRIVTLGLFSIITTGITLYLSALVYPGLQIKDLTVPKTDILGTVIPQTDITFPLSYLVISATIYAIIKILNWIFQS